MVWNMWQVMPPPSKEQQKKLQDIPDSIFWIKMIIMMIIMGSMLLSFYFLF